MVKYVLNRLLLLVLTLFILSFIIFALLELMPGSPFNNPKLTAEQIAMMEKNFGLDQPMLVRYGQYIKGIITEGNFGISFQYSNLPVTSIIKEPLKVTIKIGLTSVAFGSIIGIILGAIAAIKNGTWVDSLVSFISIMGTSIPSFVLATFLIKWTADVEWLPIVYNTANAELGITKMDELRSMILPIITISTYIIAAVMRYTRSELIEVLNSDYILLARAKGVKNRDVIFKHALRNALIPVVTIIGPMCLYAITGSTIAERFFGVPGLSQQLINAINVNDYFLILGISLFYACMLVFIILIIDLLYGVIDPRIRVSGGKSHE